MDGEPYELGVGADLCMTLRATMICQYHLLLYELGSRRLRVCQGNLAVVPGHGRVRGSLRVNWASRSNGYPVPRVPLFGLSMRSYRAHFANTI
jgi:hypothetical protein